MGVQGATEGGLATTSTMYSSGNRQGVVGEVPTMGAGLANDNKRRYEAEPPILEMTRNTKRKPNRPLRNAWQARWGNWRAFLHHTTNTGDGPALIATATGADERQEGGPEVTTDQAGPASPPIHGPDRDVTRASIDAGSHAFVPGHGPRRLRVRLVRNGGGLCPRRGMRGTPNGTYGKRIIGLEVSGPGQVRVASLSLFLEVRLGHLLFVWLTIRRDWREGTPRTSCGTRVMGYSSLWSPGPLLPLEVRGPFLLYLHLTNCRGRQRRHTFCRLAHYRGRAGNSTTRHTGSSGKICGGESWCLEPASGLGVEGIFLFFFCCFGIV